MLNPDQIHTLLHSQGSLTAQLERIAGQPLQVKIIGERYARPSLQQKLKLGLPLAKPCLVWVREVALYGTDKTAWVQAMSVFPLTSLVGEGRRLKQLGNTPIGYVLFARQKYLPHVRTINGKTRQTVYEWRGRKILIEECFL